MLPSSRVSGLYRVHVWVSDAQCDRVSLPLLSAIGQRLIFNLRGFQAQLFTTRDISREVDRQMARVGDLLWPDLGPNDGHQSGFELTEVRRS